MTSARTIDLVNPASGPLEPNPTLIEALPFTLDNSPTLLSQANTGSRGPSWTDILGNVASIGTPDAIIYSNAAPQEVGNAYLNQLARQNPPAYDSLMTYINSPARAQDRAMRPMMESLAGKYGTHRPGGER